jgi:diaminopimelate epimerase
MLAAPSHKISLIKMSGAGNSFAIFDAREAAISLTLAQIQKISQEFFCDQIILLHQSTDCDVEMEIFNRDGSVSGACGNATRCVASLFDQNEVKIKTAAGVLKCWRAGENKISVAVAVPKFLPNEIPLKNSSSENIKLFGFEFSCVNVGNPHAVSFISSIISDEKFFDVGPKVETNEIFPQKTNVEFARILSDDLIEVRVFERGAGETLACGTGACAVGILAMRKKLISKNSVTTRFKGGDLQISWNGDGSPVIMTGGYELEFVREIEVS